MLRRHAGEIEHVLVLTTLGAPRRALLGRSRAKDASADPAPVPTSRATLVDVERLDDAGAKRWLRDADGEAEAARAVTAVNRILHLQRVAAADPALREVGRHQALVVRIGYGEGEQVADGRWAEAKELPQPRRERRSAALRPQERLAALLGARDAALACEDLTLRARADVDAGRRREAALQIGVALRAGVAELEPWQERADLRARLDELRALAPGAEAAAAAALQGGVDDDVFAGAVKALERLEAALRARTAAGFD